MRPAPRVPDGLTISAAPFREQRDNKAPLISYRITARPSGSTRRRSTSSTASPSEKKIFGSIAELQGDLDRWVQSYNEERSHEGRWGFGKTPLHTFLDATPLAKEKIIAA